MLSLPPPPPDIPPKRKRSDFDDASEYEAYKKVRRSAQKAAQERQRPQRDRRGRARPARVEQQRKHTEDSNMEYVLKRRGTIAGIEHRHSDHMTLRCMIVLDQVDPAPWYIACRWCMRTMINATEDTLEAECERCGETRKGFRRWDLNATAYDATGSHCARLGGSIADQFLHGTADEISARGSEAFRADLRMCTYKQWLITGLVRPWFRSEQDTIHVMGIEPIDFVQEGRVLLWEIESMRRNV